MSESTSVTEREAPEFERELSDWLARKWNPDLTVAEWWDELAESGWAAPTWPEEWFGRGLTRSEANRVAQIISDHGALGPPTGLGMMLAGPTILAHGNEEQKKRFLEDIVKGRKAWCQLFSEPGAGSDLAGLQTKAVRDGDEWIITGQKVWTSGAQIADLGMLLARTDPDVPKHRGISWFAFPMDQDGVEIRPLKEMTGRALFNEVFITEARVRDEDLIGGLNNGWAVALTTLANERVGLGAGAAATRGGALPGTKAGHLERRAGDFVQDRPAGGQAAMNARGARMMIDLAKGFARTADPTIRQDLMRLYILDEIARYNTLRAKADRKRGRAPGAEANIAKLLMSQITRLSRDLGLRILGPAGTLHGKDAPLGGIVTEMALFSPAVSIYGGTDEIQKNIIADRVLGLPPEPRVDKDVPFRELKVGTQRAS
ncbi:MAG: acyl-CoA dehydrogenase [Acidimicrobiales bacterium]|nr:MAG: acyl-CoA dehydrogenase [Acidimicrobiales bacterium]